MKLMTLLLVVLTTFEKLRQEKNMLMAILFMKVAIVNVFMILVMLVIGFVVLTSMVMEMLIVPWKLMMMLLLKKMMAGTRKYRMMIILLLLLVIQRMMIMPMAVAVLVMTKSDGIHRIVSYSTVLGFVVSQVMKQDDEVVLARCYKQTPEVPACSAAGAMAMKSFAVRGAGRRLPLLICAICAHVAAGVTHSIRGSRGVGSAAPCASVLGYGRIPPTKSASLLTSWGK
eukprot:s101_g9.t1